MPKPTRKTVPGIRFEKEFWDTGYEYVVGVDEVGRGSWAGPLTIAAAIIPRNSRVYKIRDSKLLTEVEREALYERVAQWCTHWAVGHASQYECDTLGMSAAQKLAASRAIDGLGVTPDKVLVDGNWDFIGRGNTKTLIKGDAHCASIAAASILAKVTRDRIMRQQALNFPHYDFERNKGYPCPRHKAALQAYGPSAIHRRAWVFMNDLPWGLQHVDLVAEEEASDQQELFADALA